MIKSECLIQLRTRGLSKYQRMKYYVERTNVDAEEMKMWVNSLNIKLEG